MDNQSRLHNHSLGDVYRNGTGVNPLNRPSSHLPSTSQNSLPPVGNGNGNGNASARNGTVNGSANGFLNGSANGTANGFTNGSANGTINGSVNGSANGLTNGLTNGSVNATLNGSANGNANGMGNSIANGLPNGHTNGFINGLGNGMGNPFGNAFGNRHPTLVNTQHAGPVVRGEYSITMRVQPSQPTPPLPPPPPPQDTGSNGLRRFLDTHDLIRADADFFVDDDDDDDDDDEAEYDEDEGRGEEEEDDDYDYDYYYYGESEEDEEENEETDEEEEEDSQAQHAQEGQPASTTDRNSGNQQGNATTTATPERKECEVVNGESFDILSARLYENKPLPQIPTVAGNTQLIPTGDYGIDPEIVKIRQRSLAEKLRWRGLGRQRQRAGGSGSQPFSTTSSFPGQGILPTTSTDRIMHHRNRCYSGQFSEDGNFFFTTSQDYIARIYDTSDPFYWKYRRATEHPLGIWTITDGTLSPDNRLLALSTIDNIVALCGTDIEQGSETTLVDFGKDMQGSMNFGVRIWSVRFSGDGKEMIGGTSANSVVVYDIASEQQVLHVRTHAEDVNAVCYADKASPFILYSGSDDSTLRVWDRRAMPNRREVGCLLGHTEGLTSIDSKDDGRYILSNGKDQSMKLWDVRKMQSTSLLDSLDPLQWSTKFDYRSDRFREEDYIRHPYDSSVVTFRGHSVHKTLIKCHFSPMSSTNGRYAYTGSEDGKVWIYNLDGTVAETIDVEAITEPYSLTDVTPAVPTANAASAAAAASTSAAGAAENATSSNTTAEAGTPRNNNNNNNNGSILTSSAQAAEERSWRACVRDAAWHPTEPVIAATAWAGHKNSPTPSHGYGATLGTCTLHSWGDEGDVMDDCDELYCDHELRTLGVNGYNLRTMAGPPRA